MRFLPRRSRQRYRLLLVSRVGCLKTYIFCVNIRLSLHAQIFPLQSRLRFDLKTSKLIRLVSLIGPTLYPGSGKEDPGNEVVIGRLYSQEKVHNRVTTR